MLKLLLKRFSISFLIVASILMSSFGQIDSDESSPVPSEKSSEINVSQPTPIPTGVSPDINDPSIAKAKPVHEREVTTQLQIFLDQQNFGPGKIDGRPGEFSKKALARYQRAHGLPITETIDESLPLDSVYPIYTTYEITSEDQKKVGSVPAKPIDQAKQKYMPYTSLLEFLEERYHCDPNFLRKLNPDKKMDSLKPGDIVRVPNVAPFKLEELKEIGSLPERPEFKERVITVDTKEKMLDLTEGEKLLASFPITPGSGSLPAPPGTWKILGIAIKPWFRHDEKMLNEGKRSDDFHNIPNGPNNPVGVVWMGLNKPGIGIHGTNNPQTIGRASSHGCIRLANWDAIKLTEMASKGMKVIIK